MNPKQLTILAILVALVGGVYFISNKKREGSINKEETVKIGERAVEDFEVTAVDNVLIQQKGEQVSLTKTGDAWTVAERDNYLADATKIRGLLFSLKDMKISESRNVRGEAALNKLQLLAPDQAGIGGAGAGTLVRVDGGGGERMLVFGSNYNSAGRSGRFIKTKGGDVYVVSTVLRNLETDPAAWLEKEFFKVEKSEKITVKHEKPEDSFTLVRESEGSPLTLVDAAEGEELNATKLGSLNNILASANFADFIVGDDAKPEKTGLDKPVTATIETFDGFTYVVSVGKKTNDSKYYFSYQVSAEIPEAPAPEPEPNEEEISKLSDEERATQAAERQAREEKRSDHTRLTEKLAKEEKLAGKVYSVDSWLVEKILAKRSELLMTEEDRKKAAEAAANPTPNPALGGGAPNIISQGPNGERRITATTPPVSVPPEILEAERKKQEAAIIEQRKAQENAAAIKNMLDDLKREEAEKSGQLDGAKPVEGEEAEPAPVEEAAEGADAPPADGGEANGEGAAAETDGGSVEEDAPAVEEDAAPVE